MIRRSLELVAVRSKNGSTVLCAPAVGHYSGAPLAGECVLSESPRGTLVVLGRKIDLLVPEGVEGRVVEVHVSVPFSAVEYGQPLFTLERRAGRRKGHAENKGDAGRVSGPEPRSASLATSIGPGEHALRAPTTGIFYSRPDPSSPSFVSVGSTLETGQTAGLIEVMKCFSPIVHPGGTIPSPAVVSRIEVREGEEVSPGKVLFVLRPA